MKDKQFLRALFVVIRENIWNNHSDNWDRYRFGPEIKPNLILRIKDELRNAIKYLKYYFNSTGIVYFPVKGDRDPLKSFSYLYFLLGEERDRLLLLDLVAYRILGGLKVKLPVNNSSYWNGIKEMEKLVEPGDVISSNFNDFFLTKMNLQKLNKPLKFYFSPYGTFIDFILEQYQYKNSSKIIRVKPGDFVIDAGGCWGDTALYFADAVGEQGKVFSFEFIPSNLKIFKTNLDMNKHLDQRISVVENPIWDSSDLSLKYIDNGPGSKVFQSGNETPDGEVVTLTIDDLVSRRNLSRINFIKMDIEGAEINALRGAKETIIRFKPTLAIAIYHSSDDFMDIPRFIHELVSWL